MGSSECRLLIYPLERDLMKGSRGFDPLVGDAWKWSTRKVTLVGVTEGRSNEGVPYNGPQMGFLVRGFTGQRPLKGTLEGIPWRWAP
jgi:hypothetical protein